MNELKKRAEFEKLLADYTVSEHGKKLLAETKLLLMAGVSSSGRNTVLEELKKTGDYHFIISDTTRKPRLNHGVPEKNGIEYWFKSEDEFLDGIRQGEYLEAAIIHSQQVSGISIREIERAHGEGKIATTDVEMNGVTNIVDVKPDAICVFMIPPNFKVWMKRINGRGIMPEIELYRRICSAVQEIKIALRDPHYIIVVNEEFHQTTKAVQHIDIDVPNQELAKQTARSLLQDTENYLALLT